MKNLNLLIDIGNTRIKWTLATTERVDREVVDYLTSDEPDDVVGQLITDVTTTLASGNDGLQSIWIACVGGDAIVQALADRALDVWGVSIEVAEVCAAAHGVRNSYEDPAQMGVDRWVALLAARQHIRDGPVVVVDAGTAITVDTLDSEGIFIGGLILPGAALARHALLANTDRIYTAEESDTSMLSPFGVTTGECVHRGSRFAAVGGVQFALERVTNVLGEMPEVILCGGGADTIARHLDREVILKPWLVLEGLALLASRD